MPLAAGRVTLDDGRIGISGSVLFAHNSDELQPEGRQLLTSLAPPLAAYLAVHDEMLMVSGFTDDRPVRDSNRQFADNWELSAQRAPAYLGQFMSYVDALLWLVRIESSRNPAQKTAAGGERGRKRKAGRGKAG